MYLPLHESFDWEIISIYRDSEISWDLQTPWCNGISVLWPETKCHWAIHGPFTFTHQIVLTKPTTTRRLQLLVCINTLIKLICMHNLLTTNYFPKFCKTTWSLNSISNKSHLLSSSNFKPASLLNSNFMVQISSQPLYWIQISCRMDWWNPWAHPMAYGWLTMACLSQRAVGSWEALAYREGQPLKWRLWIRLKFHDRLMETEGAHAAQDVPSIIRGKNRPLVDNS